MSINFDEPISEDVRQTLLERFGMPVAHDDKTFIYNDLKDLNRSEMTAIANKAKQCVSVELHSIGDTKVIKRVCYELTAKGWIKQSELN